MITLTKAQVFKYKSIEDSSPVEVARDVTVLVGKNESGKTAFLEALHKALPHGGEKFDVVFDYPKKDYFRYRKNHDAKDFAKVVELTFRIEKDLAEKINLEVFEGAAVIKPGHTFTRDTNYGNNSSIGFHLDQTAALAALRKTLDGIDRVEEMFAGADRLEDVLARIDEEKLQADSSLAQFSKLWRDAFAKASGGWGILDWHIWNKYLRDSLPQFFYFDDYRLLEGKINLESLNQRKANPAQLTDADKTVFGLFELAGTTIEELTSEEGYENSKAKLEAIGLAITQQVFEYWRQNKELEVEFDIKADPKDQPPFNNGKNLYIRIKNLRHGVTVPFDQRSKGFIWFFSFMVWFSAVENRIGTKKALTLLLDEPGLNLHALAQSDFLAYIDRLSKSRQILYTTHSPFMVESDRLDKVRVVEDRPKDGTKVTGDLAGANDESLFPLQAALGYSVAQNLFIAKKNILIEGPADLILLLHMSAILEGRGSGLNEGVFVPVGGLDKLATFIALLGANKLRLVVLHDRGGSPSQHLENLIRQKLVERKRVLDYSLFTTRGNQETDIEDLLPEALYINAFNATYSKELNGKVLTAADLGPHPRVVERINKWLVSQGITLLKEGGFNHYRVAQTLLPALTATSLSAADLQPFEKLFTNLNELLK